MKKIFLLTILAVMSLVSCTKQEDPIAEKITPTANKVYNLDSISKSIQSSKVWPADLLQNWSLVDYATGTMLLKRDNEGSVNTYLVIAKLTQGAKVGMVFDAPTNGYFTRKYLSTWNTYGSFFAIANSSFFNANQITSCELPFPLKQDGIMYTYGTGGSTSDQSKQKVVLNVYDQEQYAEIVSIGTSPMNYTPMGWSNKSYAGFAGNIGNSPSYSTGRTMVGVKDANGDGYCEFVMLLVTSGKTQSQVYNIMTQEVLCDDVMTFDGGGSSQFLCPTTSSSPLISGDNRKLPVTIVIKHG